MLNLFYLLFGQGSPVAGPPVATAVEITAQPGSATSGVLLAPQFTVRVVDQYGALFSSTAVITLVIQSGTGTIAAGASKACVAGVAVFTATILTALVGGLITIRADSPGLTSDVATPFTLTVLAPGLVTQLVCTRLPSGAESGFPLRIQPRFEWRDSTDTLVTTETAPVSIAVIGNAAAVGTTSVPAVGGVVDFAGSGFGLLGRGDVDLDCTGDPA